MGWMRRGLNGLILMGVVFYGPLLVTYLRSDIRTVATAAPTDAVLVFGALVRDGQISPLHAQRLDTAIALWLDGKTDQIVVSNAQRAAQVMADYLATNGVPGDVIVIDGTAVHTPETCLRERSLGPDRRVSFISQTFHLPRIAYQCAQLGVTGQLITATQGSAAPMLTKIRVRATRLTREAGLLWGAILRLYPE